MLGETLRHARSQVEEAIERLAGEQRIVQRGLTRCHAEIRRTGTTEPDSPAATGRIADLTDEVGQAKRRLTEIDRQLAELRRDLVTESDVAAGLYDFDNVWAALTPREQVRLIGLLVHRVEFDSTDSSLEFSFYPSGIKAMANDDNPIGEAENAA